MDIGFRKVADLTVYQNPRVVLCVLTIYSSHRMDNCAHCKKPSSSLPNGLKKCARCKSVAYCSPKCKNAGRKLHKSTCDHFVHSSASNRHIQWQVHVTEPSTLEDVKSEDALHRLPEKEVYRRLIDIYRLRVEDERAFAGNLVGIHNNEDSIACFQKFLDLAEAREGVLPPWWSKEKRGECEELGKIKGGWSDLSRGVQKVDLQNHYKDPLMPMRMRYLSERIYPKRLFEIRWSFSQVVWMMVLRFLLWRKGI